MYTYKKVTSLKVNSMVARPVQVVLLNMTKDFCQHITNHGHPYAGIFPVSKFYTEEEDRSTGVTDENVVAARSDRDKSIYTFL